MTQNKHALEEKVIENWPPQAIKLDKNKRVLFLTKDLELIKKQLYHGLNLQMSDLSVDELLDDINTDIMTPAWACFNHRPADIAVFAYAGLMHEGQRVFADRALLDGNFQLIVSGKRKGTGSSRETAAQCERWSGIRLIAAASFAPIHERNNINLGQLCLNHDNVRDLQAGQAIALTEIIKKYDSITQKILSCGGLFPFSRQLMHNPDLIEHPKNAARPMNMTEKLALGKMPTAQQNTFLKPGDVIVAQVDGGYSHEFTTAQVHEFLKEEFGADYQLKNPSKFAIFEDHLIYADQVKSMTPYMPQIKVLRALQNDFCAHTGVRNFSASNGLSPGICHEVAREEIIEPGDFIQATDSHTCMGGCLNALTFGVGATEYAALAYSGLTLLTIPEAIRFELVGELPKNCTAKDIMLHILASYAKNEQTLNRAMEFTGPGLKLLSLDERATLCNMATECGAKTGICESDEATAQWLAARRNKEANFFKSLAVSPDQNAIYDGGIHFIDLSKLKPMVAHPGNPDQGIASDPTNGALISEIGDVPIDIAYGGSCTAGKYDDIAYYAEVTRAYLAKGMSVPKHVSFFIQFGSASVHEYAKKQGFIELFEKAGVKLLNPGCGACIGCGPGVSTSRDQVTVSAINRNFQGRSGPGKLYLASPLTVAASAFAGKISAYALP